MGDDDATSPLWQRLSDEQMKLIETIYEPFGRSAEWPIWQYVDLTLDAWGTDAATLLASLPRVGGPGPTTPRYALTWYMNSGMFVPQPDQPIALTVAGLQYIDAAQPLLGAFLATLNLLVEQQRTLVPSPSQIVEAHVTSDDLAARILDASVEGLSAPPVAQTLNKLRQLFEHEPILNAGVRRPHPDSEQWSVQVPAAIRELRSITTIDEYVARISRWVSPPTVQSALSLGALDIPYALGYLDAVWTNATGNHLFVNLDPASVARLTQACTSEVSFNSLLSALADVLGQFVPPGKTKPSQHGALEELREGLKALSTVESVDRIKAAIDTLIQIRHLRVSTQHQDARHRAVTAFDKLGLPFPPASWEQAWLQIATLACQSLDIIREEAHTLTNVRSDQA